MPKPTNIKLIIFDVDGVLTDGSIILDQNGVETKRFNVRDGFAMAKAPSVGLKVAVLTSRSSRAVTVRMNELGVELLIQGAKDKTIGFETLCQQAGVQPDEVAFLGDDLVDLPAMVRCGYPMAVGDAAPELQEVAVYTTRAQGGRGAAREAIEHILKAQDKWDTILERYGM